MLARTADNLFWLSRYVERAESLARILDVALRLSTLPSAYAGTSNEWESAIDTAVCHDAFYSAHKEANERTVTEFIIAGKTNPSSIQRCIENARQNARAVRAAITTEVWEILNDAWNQLQRQKLTAMSGQDLTRFLAFVKEVSLRFDGTAYRTMLRTDHYWFQRLGMYIERADNTARLLDVKYHVVLPAAEKVGGGLDYFQWSTLLRALSALNSYHLIYREGIKPWLVADFLILRPEQPRSLISTYKNLNDVLDLLADRYGRQGPSQRLARSTFAQLQNVDTDALFQKGLHEFLVAFLQDNNRLGNAISEQYLQ
ncbi:Domain of unknown function DUF403 [Rhabdaerophilaceae bacterium]